METNDEEKNAIGKLLKKNFDMVVLNSMNDSKATFGFDTNKITIVKSNMRQMVYGLKAKSEVAKDIVAEVLLMEREIKSTEYVRMYDAVRTNP